MSEKPTHIRVLPTDDVSTALTVGRVYSVTNWRNGRPCVTNDIGTEHHRLITSTWEPAEPPAAFAAERAAATVVDWNPDPWPERPADPAPRPTTPCDACTGGCIDPADCSGLRTRVFTLAETTGYPDDNPKTVQGLAKPGLRAVPPLALLELGRVMNHGAEKYGRFNYRANRITASTYYDAAMRHLMAWHDGQDDDPESGLPHLAHVMACCGIALDSASLGMLNDDRTPGSFAEYVARYTAKVST